MEGIRASPPTARSRPQLFWKISCSSEEAGYQLAMLGRASRADPRRAARTGGQQAAWCQRHPGEVALARALKNGVGPSKGDQPSTRSHHFGHQVNSCSTEHRQLSFSLCQEALETLYEDN